MEWRAIKDAPKDGKTVDLWAKLWRPHYDDFVYRRFPDCYWLKTDSMSNSQAHWSNLSKEWCPTHWMPLPEPPK